MSAQNALYRLHLRHQKGQCGRHYVVNWSKAVLREFLSQVGLGADSGLMPHIAPCRRGVPEADIPAIFTIS
jgi:hypothetical protein